MLFLTYTPPEQRPRYITPDEINAYADGIERDAALREWIKLKTPKIVEMLKNLPTEFTLSPLPPVVDQGQLASSSVCGVHAGMSRYAGPLRVAGEPIYMKSGPVGRELRYFIDMEAKIHWGKAAKFLDSGAKSATVEDAVSDS